MQQARRAEDAQTCGNHANPICGEGIGPADSARGHLHVAPGSAEEAPAGPSTLSAEVARLRRELARAKRRIAELEQLADRDMLTPLLNRRAFAREMSRLLSRCTRPDIAASLIYFDLDDLKRINDLLGHEAGDAALLHVAHLITSHIRSCDLAGRLGGDEFGVVLRQADSAAAERKAQAVAATLARRPLWWQGRPVALGMAFGVCALSADLDVPTVLARADRAMYRRKRGLKETMFDLLKR